MYIIVGSAALNHCIKGFRKPNDIDVWTNRKEHTLPKKYDTCYIPNNILNLIPTQEGSRSATPDAVYTIKCSHLGWDIFFEKHKRDVLYLKHLGCKLIPELYEALVVHWKATHGNKDFLSLYRDKTEFFNDFVDYKYDHDYLHELVAYPNKPMYNKCLKEGKEVAIDKAKFDLMPFEDQVQMFKEEIAVIALERWLIPEKYHGKVTLTKAWKYSLRKTVTQLTKNWATEFLILNLDQFYKPDLTLFTDHVLNKLEEGKIIMGNKLTTEQDLALRKELSEASGEVEEVYDWDHLVNEGLEYSGIEGVEHLEQEGGGEGGAEECHTVFKFKDKIYIITYSYYSYNGFEFDYSEVYEVKPVERTVTVYE